jgi:phosphatidylserine/phosphatidylglycerophosphate/cardiolipin synthase-like enzyme
MSTEKRQLLVMPDDGAEPVIRAIDAAAKTVEIKMFIFSEPKLIDAVKAAKARGVQVRVMLNPARRSGEAENEQTRKVLEAAGIEVKDTHPDFDVSHEKSMVVDSRTALIKSLNWAPKNFTHTRDYAVVTTVADEVAEVLECFNADWDRTSFDGGKAKLVWCRGNGRERIARLIDEAKETLCLQNERYQDTTIIEHLIRAHSRGVHVRIMALPPHSLKDAKLRTGVDGLRLMSDVGIKIHKLKDLHLHAKMLLADGKRAIVGSMNITPGSFDDRRELAIEVVDPHIIKRLKDTFEKDWDNSHKLDLSDEGIAADLAKHGRETGSLALSVEDNDHRS